MDSSPINEDYTSPDGAEPPAVEHYPALIRILDRPGTPRRSAYGSRTAQTDPHSATLLLHVKSRA